MKSSPKDIAKNLIDVSTTLPDGEAFLREIRDALNAKLRDGGKAIAVTLTTPNGSAPELAATVSKYLQSKLGRSADVTERADPSLIGGAVLQYGDVQIDLSIRGALSDLEASIRDGHVVS
jgi:F-type H+-transporting ATPase subunit delta